MNLQEHIRRILREENYSPAGKEIMTNKIVIHKSNPMFRDKITEQGLKVRAGECYKIYAGYGEKCIPAIFATNSTNKRASFDSTYDDDVWEIDTEMIPDVKWYKDRHYESRSKHIVTFENIPANAITLKHEGTGKDWGLMESIRKVLREELNESTYLRRRVDMSTIDEEFYKNLNIVTDRFLMLSSGKQSYSFNEFRTTVISYLIDDYRDNLSDQDYDNLPYDEVYEYLSNHFHDKIKDRYDEVFGGYINESKNIRRVLQEETNYLRLNK